MSIDRVNVTKRGKDRSQAAQGSELMRSTKKMKESDRLAAQIEQSRTERLNTVRQKLESGTYRVSAKTIARKLIDSNRK